MLPSILLLSAVLSVPATPSEIAPALVEMLRRDEHVTAYLHIATDPLGDWRALSEVLDEYQCISVPSYESAVSIDGTNARVTVTIDATALHIGATRAPARLPREWIIEAEQAGHLWRLRHIRLPERYAALEIKAAEPARQRELFDLYLQTLDAEGLVWNVGDVGRTDKETGRLLLETVVDATRDLQSARLETQALFSLATWHRYQREIEDMRHYSELALEVSRTVPDDPETLLRGLFAAAMAAGQYGDLDRSTQLNLDAAALIPILDDPRMALGAHYNAASMETQRGRLVEALRLAQQNVEWCRHYGWKHGEMLALFVLAAVHGELRNMEAALQLDLQLVELTRLLRSKRYEAVALGNLGSDYTTLGDAESAIRVTREAIAIETEIGAPEHDLAASYLLLGEALVAAGRIEEAEAALMKATVEGQPFPVREVGALVARSEIRLMKGDAAGALELAQQAVKVETDGVELVGDSATFRPWSAKSAEARALRALGRKAEAEAAFRAAVKIVESLRRSFSAPEGSSYGFMAGKTDVHRQLADLLVEDGRASEALELTSAVKARALLDAVQHGKVDPFAGITDEERARYDELNDAIEKLNVQLLWASPAGNRDAVQAKLAAARTELGTFELALFARHRPMRVTAAQRPPADPASLVSEGTAIVEYLVGEESTLAFVIAPGKPVVAKKIAISRKELQGRVAAYMKRIERRDLTHHTDGAWLYSLLMQPLEPHLGDAQVLCIVPDGALWQVPFQALKTADKRYLIESRAIFYAPSLGALQLARSREHVKKPRSVVAVGNPTVAMHTASNMRALYRDAAQLGDLPDAEEEARKVGRMYPSARVLTGADAREERVKEAAGSADVLHFATHALVNDSQPLYSSIVLSADAAEDGLLEAREILSSDLDADLVVLSACSTARGEISPGEGLVGLTWSFLIAGASSTVAAQWPVLSKSTADLMVEFHRKLTAPTRMRKAEALRQAQLSVMKRRGYEHPFYWSPFVLVGAD